MTDSVYHGSYVKIREVNLSFCQKGRDFGRGFYVTKFRSQAEQWAIRKGRWRNTQGEVTEFWFHEELAGILKLKFLKFDGYTSDWLDFIVLNRTNPSPAQQAHDYDLVEGPVADDDIATRIMYYINGSVPKEQFLSELTYKTPTHQLCFCTDRSLSVLITQESRTAGAISKMDNEIVLALMMDCNINEMEAVDRYYTSKTYTQLADESTGLYEKPWQEIYEMLKKELGIGEFNHEPHKPHEQGK